MGFIVHPKEERRIWSQKSEFGEPIPLLMKAGWNLCTKPNDIWVKEVCAKYQCDNDIFPVVDQRRPGSNLRREIVKVWDSLCPNLIWTVGNGRRIHF